MKIEQLDRAELLNSDDGHPELQRIPTAREVLAELFELLEDYAPTWYTEEHHNRAVAALLRVEDDDTAGEHGPRGR